LIYREDFERLRRASLGEGSVDFLREVIAGLS
jgi:hypothetical protein